MLTPKEIHIEGDFWDTILYHDTLFLWTMDGILRSFDWREIEQFAHGRSRLELSMSDIIKFERNNSYHDIDSLPSDIDIHNDNIYMTMDEGLFFCPLTDRNHSSIINQLCETPFLRLSIRKNGRMALSAGEEGLFEYNISNPPLFYGNDVKETEPNLYQISTKHSLSANWIYSSIYSNSNKSPSYLAGYIWERGIIKYNHIINENEIFDNHAGRISWVFNGFIYKATDGGIIRVKYHQQDQSFSGYKYIPFQPWKGRILGASAAPFGSIIECEKAIVVMKDESNYHNIPGEAARWRVFSKNPLYSNQLHIVYENKVSIFIF